MRSFGTMEREMVAGGSERPALGMPLLPVAKARKMSPLALYRQERRAGGEDHDDLSRPRRRRPLRFERRRDMLCG